MLQKKLLGKHGLYLSLTPALVFALASHALAVPYASGISESGTTVTYVLNEDADAITVMRQDLSELILSGDDLLKGTHTFDRGTTETAYEIAVSKSAAVGWTQISDDTLLQSKYFSPMGVAVNQNPASEYFGWIYVSEGTGGITGGDTVRETFEGIYVLSADQGDVLNQGEFSACGGPVLCSPLTGWDPSNRNSPFKITIAPDDNIYIADWSDGHSGVWRAPPHLDANDPQAVWPRILANETNVNDGSGGLYDNHGSVSSVWVEGKDASTKLYTADEDWDGPPVEPATVPSGRGDVLRYDIGESTDYTGQPDTQVDDTVPAPNGKIWNGLTDIVRDEDGTWWRAQYRFTDTEAIPSLTHWADGGTEALYASGRPEGLRDADFDNDTDVDGDDLLTWQRGNGTETGGQPGNGDANFNGVIDGDDEVIWEDQFGSLQDSLNLDTAYGSIDIHNELDLLVMGARSSGGVYILDISDPDNPMITDIIPQFGFTRDVAFDIAGNVYVNSSSSETLRIWSPGGDSIATTGSDGTFTLGPQDTATAVPEPSGLGIVLMGLCCLAGGRLPSRQR